MNIRLLIPFMILGILVLVVLFSALQIALHYAKANKDKQEVDSIKFAETDSKEQIITDLTAENERLNAELKKLQDSDSPD